MNGIYVYPNAQNHDSYYNPQYTQYPGGIYGQQRSRFTFVLVHGSWVGPQFWDGIAHELRMMGHIVYTPQLPGHGTDSNKDVTHAQITQSVVDFITSRNLHDVILVGHSFGGSVIQKAAETVSDRLKRLVWWNAFVLNDGESVADQFPPSVQELFLTLAQQSGNYTVQLPFPFFRDIFVNLADLQTAQQIYQSTIAEPLTPAIEKIELKKFFQLQTPKSYLNLQEDTVVPAGETYGWYPHLASRLGVYRFIQGHGDHLSTARTHTKRVAELILKAGRD